MAFSNRLDLWGDPWYALRCANTLIAIQQSPLSVEDLVGELKHMVGAEAAGVVWIKPAAPHSLDFALPSVKVTRGLISARAGKAMQLLLETPRMWLHLTGYRRSSRMQDFVCLKIPSLTQQSIGCSAIVLINRHITGPPTSSLDQLDLDPLASIIDTWAWRVVHYRFQLHETCRHLAMEGLDSPNAAFHFQRIQRYVGDLSGQLCLEDILEVTDSLARSRAVPRADVHRWLSDSFGHNLAGFRESPYFRRALGFSGRLHRKETSRALISSSWWGGLTARDVAESRRGSRSSQPLALPDRANATVDLATHTRKRTFSALLSALRPCVLFQAGQNLLPRKVLSYPFYHALRGTPERNAYLGSEAAGSSDIARILSSSATVARYLLMDEPLSSTAIWSMLVLISEYGHKTLRIPDRVDLVAHLLHAARDEPALLALKPFHRDHLLHALEVSALGHILLDTSFAGKPLWKTVARFLPYPANRQGVLRLWYLAALLHDVGYSVDVLRKTADHLGFFAENSSASHLASKISSAFSSASQQLGTLPINQRDHLDLSSLPIGADHGVVAGQHLALLLESIALNDRSTREVELKKATEAISWHNLRSLSVPFHANPIAFLLILCDTIQEWNRPNIPFSTSALGLGRGLPYTASPRADQDSSMVSFTTNISPLQRPKNSAHFAVLEEAEPLALHLVFGPDLLKDSAVFNLWIDMSSNLQRLDVAGLPFDIEISIDTPLPDQAMSDLSVNHMDRLRNAATETHMSFLENWFPNRRESATVTRNSFLKHTVISQTPSLERLTMTLSELTKARPITQDIAAFRTHLAKWRHYNNDKLFVGDYACPDRVG